ncbi:ParA family protein [Amphibiibacter pelophylacis]|uniref:AAA family ATPase n=1 Tax=Amphibiibacter pelophylacis TaxID=1799477 RepID=A0ACC6P1F5_9BURK
MSTILCIANQKGGVGKTTTTVNLAAGLTQLGQRVLVVDLDPQGNATMGSGVDKTALRPTIYDLLLGQSAARDCILDAGETGYRIIGSNRDLAAAEIELVDLPRRNLRLADALAPVQDDFDQILIDCPPSLSLLSLNGFCCAHGVVVPMQCEYFALEGLTDLMNTVRQVKAKLNPKLKLVALLRVMFDPRVSLQAEVAEQVKAHFGDRVFDAVIPRNVRLAEAPSFGLPGVLFDKSSKGAKAYMAFAQEMLDKLPGFMAKSA